MNGPAANTGVERLTGFSDEELDELCEATDEAILDGNGFGWLQPPRRRVLESYWRGVLLVPERELYVARLEGRIVGSAQLLKPPPNNEAGAHAAELSTFFIAPWARGHGLARGLLRACEESARGQRFRQLDLSVRATQEAAIKLYEDAGFVRWAVNERYACIDGKYVAGYCYTKVFDGPRPAAAATRPGKPAQAKRAAPAPAAGADEA
jgi:ribosomal protein S18 acetylase RimI-like enzyme